MRKTPKKARIYDVTPEIINELLSKNNTYVDLLSDFNKNNYLLLEIFSNYFHYKEYFTATEIYESLLEKKNSLIKKMNFENKRDYKMSIEYYIECGWTLENAKKKIIKNNRNCVVSFEPSDVKNYLIDVNPYNMNIDNDVYLDMFISKYCNFKTAMNTYRLDIAFNKLLSDTYTTSKINKGYVTESVDYYIARGFSQEEAKNKISKLQKSRSLYSIDYYTKKGIDENTAKEIIKRIQSLQLGERNSEKINEILKEYGIEKTGFKNRKVYNGEQYIKHDKKYKLKESDLYMENDNEIAIECYELF